MYLRRPAAYFESETGIILEDLKEIETLTRQDQKIPIFHISTSQDHRARWVANEWLVNQENDLPGTRFTGKLRQSSSGMSTSLILILNALRGQVF